MKKREKKVQSIMVLRKKLYAAMAMLLVSAIMLVSTSYAWLVLSTHPEVTGISTQVGANGSLEIALLDTESYNDITKIAEADIDESALHSLKSSNLSWGNLVNLGGSEYGLSEIVLNPSRLNIAQSGTDGEGNTRYRVNEQTLLKTPVYGEDGRITGLEQTAVSTVYGENKTFSFGGSTEYGVRAIGTSSSMNSYQLGINAARSALSTNMSSARTAASGILNSTGGDLGKIALSYALAKMDKTTSSYTISDVEALKTLAEGLLVSLDYIDTALRQVFVGYISTKEANVPLEDYAEKKAEIEDKAKTLTELQTQYTGVDISEYINLLKEDQTTVETAVKGCEDLIAADKPSYTEADILNVMRPLINYDNITLAGKTVEELSGMEIGELAGIVMQGGLTITVPSGSGVLSDIADFAGDYTAAVTVENVNIPGIGSMDKVTATMKTASNVNPVYLTRCSNMLKGFTAGSDEGAGTVITNYYGYALDLGFRTNMADSELLLQTESAQRIYDDSENAATQGGGSYMEFTSDAGLSTTKMVKLMSALRVVFVDKEQNVLAIAALDTTLGQDAYTVLTAEQQEAMKKYAVLTEAKAVQNSDYITKAEYEALPTETVVQLNEETGAVKAPLFLRDFSMTLSDTSTETETNYTGGITLGGKKSSAAITELEENTAQHVTAIVYLDGSFVSNSMVAAEGTYSMTGVLNLQFADSKAQYMTPMENQKLREGEAEEKEPSGTPEEGETKG